jgi:hypothetical protein
MQFLANRTVEFVWAKLENVAIERRDSNYVARLRGLEPGQAVIVRVVPEPGDGVEEGRIFATSLLTQRKVSWTSHMPKFTALRGLLLVLVGLVGWQLWERWRLHSLLR